MCSSFVLQFQIHKHKNMACPINCEVQYFMFFKACFLIGHGRIDQNCSVIFSATLATKEDKGWTVPSSSYITLCLDIRFALLSPHSASCSVWTRACTHTKPADEENLLQSIGAPVKSSLQLHGLQLCTDSVWIAVFVVRRFKQKLSYPV